MCVHFGSTSANANNIVISDINVVGLAFAKGFGKIMCKNMQHFQSQSVKCAWKKLLQQAVL